MPLTDEPLDSSRDDEVHVLHAAPAARRGPLGLLLGLAGLALVGGAGVWVWLNPDVLESRAALPPPPPAAAGNLLGDGWSFETTEAGSAASSWVQPEEAPAGFAFQASGRVSGELGAVSEAAPGGWARLLLAQPVALGAHRGQVELSGVSGSPDVQLLLRFEAPGRAPVDVVVASGEGRLTGRATVPPGSSGVRAGLQAIGPGSADDLDLRLVEGGEDLGVRGVFSGLRWQRGALVFKGAELVARLEGLSVRDAEGRLPPFPVGELPGEEAVATSAGVRVRVTNSVQSDEKLVRLVETLDGIPPGSSVVRTIVVAGSLALQPVGVVSGRGFERFTADFRVEGVRSIVLGRTTDRLGIGLGGEAALTGAWLPDGSILLRAEVPAEGSFARTLELQTNFQAERVAAAQQRDLARAAEAAGRLGEALAHCETIATEYPHDEDVLAEAVSLRGRIQAEMQARLDRIDADLDDALFLASASRCREVLAECRAAAETFRGSEAEARFRERAAQVARGAEDLLEEDRARHAGALAAVRDSFAAAGGYDEVVAELDRYLAEHLAPGSEARPEDGPGPGQDDAP